MSLSNAIREYDNNDELLRYLEEEIICPGKKEEVMQEMEYDNPVNGTKTWGTPLHLALDYNKPKEVIFKLVDIGGQELVMTIGDKGTPLHSHVGCWNKDASLDIISKLLAVGGRKLLMVEHDYERTALHHACWNINASLNIISKLIEVGGRELLTTMKTNTTN